MVTAWRNIIKPGRLPEAEAFPSPDPQPARTESPPAPTRRGFFVAVDEGCNFLGVECFGGLSEGDYMLLCFASAHHYAERAVRELARQTAEKGAGDGGTSD